MAYHHYHLAAGGRKHPIITKPEVLGLNNTELFTAPTHTGPAQTARASKTNQACAMQTKLNIDCWESTLTGSIHTVLSEFSLLIFWVFLHRQDPEHLIKVALSATLLRETVITGLMTGGFQREPRQ